MLEVWFLNGMLLDRFWFVFLNRCQAQSTHGAFVNLQIKSVQLLFFSHLCPGEFSLNIRVQHSYCPLCSALDAHPDKMLYRQQGAGGLLFPPAGLRSGEKPCSQDLSSFHRSLAVVQHLLFILSWPLEIPPEIEILLRRPLAIAGGCHHRRGLLL